MRLHAFAILFGLTFATATPAIAADADGSGVTVWRGNSNGGSDGGLSGETHRKQDDGLPAWIRQSRDRISAAGTAPIPRDIQKRFRHAFPAGLFDWARFGISADERIWRQASRRGYGTALVLVLDDVILFRNTNAAHSHTAWYDGLAQAQEFRRFGPEKVLARRASGPSRYLDEPRTVYPYPFPVREIPYGRGRPAPATDPNKSITVPGLIIVKPVYPYRAD